MGGGSDQIVEGVRDMVASGGVHRPYFRGVLRGSLLRGDFRLDIYFTLWRYNVVKAISLWRSAYRMVEFRERGLIGKYFSRWNRTVWMAQSQSYWKNELDHSIQQIEEQRIAWEERVEELELSSSATCRPSARTSTRGLRRRWRSRRRGTRSLGVSRALAPMTRPAGRRTA